jgi:hypothetical protein
MVDFTKPTVADMAADNPGSEMGTTGRVTEIAWGDEDLYWRGEYHRRPYARADRGYDHYRAAYQYGTTAAQRQPGAEGGWHGVESHLATGWENARQGSSAAWEEIRDAVRDAWERVRGRLTAK